MYSATGRFPLLVSAEVRPRWMRLAAFTFVIGSTLITALRAILGTRCAIARGGPSRVHQIHDRAVVAERSTATEVGDGGEDVFHAQTLGSHGFQSFWSAICASIHRLWSCHQDSECS